MVTKEVLSKAVTEKGESLLELSEKVKTLVVFLRHLGCVFCQEAIQDLRKLIDENKLNDIQLVFVHMANPDIAIDFFKDFKISLENQISDPDCKLYENFGLIKATTRELFSFQVMLRTAENAILKGNLPSKKRIGDGFQMPGVFVLKDGKILNSYIHKRISDRPDYLKMIS